MELCFPATAYIFCRMDTRAAIEKLINLRSPGPVAHLLLFPLTLCSYLYGLGMSCRTLLYRAGILKSHRIACKVVTVGNITVGGTGKTPTVCMLAQHFKQSGVRVAALCRGYRGSTTATPQIVSDGASVLASAEAAGDEAVMLSRKLPGIPVLAAADRVAAGALAVKRFAAQVAILDDGFQHLRLRRDADIVLVNATNPFGNGFLLPRGILRETPAALQRAHIVLLTKTNVSAAAVATLRETIRRYNPGAPVFTAAYKVRGLRTALSGEDIPRAALAGRRVAALCSIGDPEGFIALIEGLHAVLIEKILFPDHHAYRHEDYRRIAELSRQVDSIITTEKDIAKINPDMVQPDKLIVMEIEQVVDDQERFFNALRDRLGL